MKKGVDGRIVSSSKRLACAICLALVCGALPSPASELTEGLPAESKREGMARMDALAKKGPQAVRDCVDLLVEPGKGRDSDARRALHGLSLYVCQDGKEEVRDMVEDAYIAALKSKRAPQVKVFLIRQLQVMGTDRCLPVLARCLKKDELRGAAIQALVAIGSPESLDPLRRAAKRTRKSERRAPLMALARLGDEPSIERFMKATESEDSQTRLIGYYGLANCGAVDAGEAFDRALACSSRLERAKNLGSFALWVRRLAEKGHSEQAVSILREKLSSVPDGASSLRCSVLSLLAEIHGAASLPDVLQALVSGDAEVAEKAAGILVRMPGKDVDDRLEHRFQQADAAKRSRILEIFARRDSKGVLPSVLNALGDETAGVRLTAIRTAVQLNADASMPALLKVLEEGSEEEARTARDAIVSVPGPEILSTVSKAISGSGSSRQKAALIGVLEAKDAKEHLDVVVAASKDPSPEVRAAAAEALGSLGGPSEISLLLALLEDDAARKEAEKSLGAVCARASDLGSASEPVVRAMEGASAPARCSMLRVLGKNGDKTALAAVERALDEDDPDVRDAAIRSLAGWPNAEAAETLLSLIRETQEETHRILCLRGYIRLAGMTGDPSSKQRLDMYKRSMELATRPEEMRMVLGGLGDMASNEALVEAMKAVETEGLSEEAISASFKIGRALHMIDRTAARKALGTVLERSDNEELRKEAGTLLKKIEEYADYVTAWMVAGPYSKDGMDCQGVFDEAFPPETGGTRDRDWRLMTVGSELHPMLLEIGSQLKGEDRAAYLKTRVRAGGPQDAVIEMGTDDGVKVWFDGKLVHEVNAKRACKMSGDKVPVKLSRDWRELMLKVTQCDKSWRACARIVCPEGEPIQGLEIVPDLP